MSISVEHIILIDGVPRTENQRVKVRMIAQMYLDAGASVADVAEQYGITQADVHAALTYYFDHQAFFDERDRKNDEALKEYGISHEAWLARIKARVRKNSPE